MFTLHRAAAAALAATVVLPGHFGCSPWWDHGPPPADTADPVVEFATPEDGATIPDGDLPYGSIEVLAHDPDAGDDNGDGIRRVELTIRDADSDELVSRDIERWPTYDFGADLADGTYVLEATATSTRRAGGTSSTTSITIAVGDVAPPPTTEPPPTTTPPTTEPPPPTTAPPTTEPPPTTAPPTTEPPPPTSVPPTTEPPPTTTPPTTEPPPPTSAPPTVPPPTTTAPTTTVPPTTVPPTTEPPPTTQPGANERDRAAAASLDALNRTRAAAGLAPLELDAGMSDFAFDWSREMARTGFRHSSGPYGENIAWYSDDSLSPETAAEHFNQGWVDSPGHYANMTNARYTKVGIGLYRDDSGWWATHVFS